MKQIIENINLHKTKSAGPLKSQQITYIPTVEDDQIECTVPSYLIDGKRTILNQGYQLCFKLNYLKFKSMLPRKAIRYKNGIWNIQHLVYENVIQPLMLFINGRFIPWECIDLAIGQENYFLVVDAGREMLPYIIDSVRDPKYATIVALPSHVAYERFYPDMDENVLFAFNDMGEFDSGNMHYVFRNSTDAHHMRFHYWVTEGDVNAFPIFTDTSIKLTKENVILFSNGLFTTGIRKRLKRAQDSSTTSSIRPCYDLIESDEDIGTNPDIKFDSTLLSIGSGTNENSDRYDFAVFINGNYTPNADNISRVSTSYIAPLIQSQNVGEEVPEFLEDLQKPFELVMDRNKNYDTNVAEAIKTMLSYNASLFNPVFLEKSNLVIEEYSAEWIMANLRDDGTIIIPRQHSEMIDEFIIMLVNGSLYKYYKMAKYKANQYIVPIQDINYDDTIELLRFQNVNNGVTDLTVRKDDGFYNYSPEIINNDMVLFCKETDLDHFEFPENGLQHFPVEYSLETNEDGYTKITLENEFYYGKPLKVAYKNRFQHFWFNLVATTDKYTVNLEDKFMYCNDYSKYLVFYNGRRLGSDHYRLTLPVRPTTPFNTFDIYLTLPICEGDRLDVIYVPSLMSDAIMKPEVPVSGDIVIDKSIINYGLSTDLYMIWLNGKKVPASHIIDIDSSHMRIITDEETTETLCITKYIPDIDVLTDVFKENEALWDTIIAQLNNEEIYKLLGINGVDLSNTEESLYANAIGIRTIMYELIREQFIMNPRVDITGPFIYDYQDVDQSVIETYDSGGNALLTVADANNTDNLDNVERPWP